MVIFHILQWHMVICARQCCHLEHNTAEALAFTTLYWLDQYIISMTCTTVMVSLIQLLPLITRTVNHDLPVGPPHFNTQGGLLLSVLVFLEIHTGKMLSLTDPLLIISPRIQDLTLREGGRGLCQQGGRTLKVLKVEVKVFWFWPYFYYNYA